MNTNFLYLDNINNWKRLKTIKNIIVGIDDMSPKVFGPKLESIMPKDDFLILYVYLNKDEAVVIHNDYEGWSKLSPSCIGLLLKKYNIIGGEYIIQTKTEEQYMLIKTIVGGW